MLADLNYWVAKTFWFANYQARLIVYHLPIKAVAAFGAQLLPLVLRGVAKAYI